MIFGSRWPAGRVSVLFLQTELCQVPMSPFRIELSELVARADTEEIFGRIYWGSMLAIVSGNNLKENEGLVKVLS